MKKLLLLLFFLTTNDLYSQDQTVELCEKNTKSFRYSAIGSPNCRWQWHIYLNGGLAEIEYGEELFYTFSTPGKYRISLKIENELCESETQEYNVEVIECRRPIVLVPTAFTPNRGGPNDVFKVRASYIQKITIQIFNRWGNLFFVSNDLEIGWDGTLQGMAAPQGAYVCIVEYQDVFGNFGQQVTSLTLYR